MLKTEKNKNDLNLIELNTNFIARVFQYAMFLLAFFLLEVASGVFLYVNRERIEAISRKSLTTVFNDYSNSTDARTVVDEIQRDVSITYVSIIITEVR